VTVRNSAVDSNLGIENRRFEGFHLKVTPIIIIIHNRFLDNLLFLTSWKKLLLMLGLHPLIMTVKQK
jgi:hypothetical protein